MKLSGQLHILLADRQIREERENNPQLQERSLNLGINVLNNAMKFTHEGQIRVDVTNVAEKETPLSSATTSVTKFLPFPP